MEMGTLKGFPYPPAMVRAGQSPAAPHAMEMGDGNPQRVPKPEERRTGSAKSRLAFSPFWVARERFLFDGLQQGS